MMKIRLITEEEMTDKVGQRVEILNTPYVVREQMETSKDKCEIKGLCSFQV